MRRVAALVLPHLACEVARQRAVAPVPGPLAVILQPELGIELEATATLDLVDDEARRYGVRPGMQVTEACALVAGLSVQRVTFAEVEAALARLAEVVSTLAPTVAVRLETEGPRSLDTVWLDVTGASHLVGGEEALADELEQRARELGHRGRAAIADGPRIAEAVARFAAAHVRRPIVAAGEGARALAVLPVAALPVDPDTVGWFLRLGLVTVGDLAKLPRAALAARLPTAAPLVLDLIAGRDAAPLVPFESPRVLIESASFEEGVASSEALLFVLRGMASRLSARLVARGEACSRLEVDLALDRSIAALRAVPAELHLAVDMPAPLAAEADLVRALRARLERVELLAPAVSLRLVIPAIARARRVQLDLSRGSAADPDALPALLAELSAEIGPERLGILAIVDAHQPEHQSALVAPDLTRERPYVPVTTSHPLAAVTRLLRTPVPLGEVGLSRVVAVDQALFALGSRRFVLRLDEIGWWTPKPVSRDYLTAWFSAPPLAGEGLVYVDRHTGQGFLQGWLE